MRAFNWGLAALLTLLGIVAIGVGLATGGSDSFPGLWVEVGTALALAAFLVFVEERLRRKVDLAVEDLEGRVRLLRDEVLSQEQAAEIVAEGRRQKRFAGDFHVRCGAVHESPVLHLFEHKINGATAIALDFDPIEVDPDSVPGAPQPARSSTMVIRPPGVSSSEVAGELTRALRRQNRSADLFDFSYGLHQLDESHRLTVAAQEAGPGDAHALRGPLVVRLNDDWILTDYGLESTTTTTAYEVRSGVVPRLRALRSGHRSIVEVETATIPAPDSPTWSDAIAWLRSREHVHVREHDPDALRPLDCVTRLVSRRRAPAEPSAPV